MNFYKPLSLFLFAISLFSLTNSIEAQDPRSSKVQVKARAQMKAELQKSRKELTTIRQELTSEQNAKIDLYMDNLSVSMSEFSRIFAEFGFVNMVRDGLAMPDRPVSLYRDANTKENSYTKAHRDLKALFSLPKHRCLEMNDQIVAAGDYVKNNVWVNPPVEKLEFVRDVAAHFIRKISPDISLKDLKSRVRPLGLDVQKFNSLILELADRSRLDSFKSTLLSIPTVIAGSVAKYRPLDASHSNAIEELSKLVALDFNRRGISVQANGDLFADNLSKTSCRLEFDPCVPTWAVGSILSSNLSRTELSKAGDDFSKLDRALLDGKLFILKKGTILDFRVIRASGRKAIFSLSSGNAVIGILSCDQSTGSPVESSLKQISRSGAFKFLERIRNGQGVSGKEGKKN